MEKQQAVQRWNAIADSSDAKQWRSVPGCSQAARRPHGGCAGQGDQAGQPLRGASLRRTSFAHGPVCGEPLPLLPFMERHLGLFQPQ